jgi:DNA-binding transcriptional regulator YdaS (Cro superfamily)
MDYSKLRGKIVEVFGTQYAFAETMGMSPAAVGQRLSGKTNWTTPEVAKACDLLGIPLEEAHLYFFTLKV